MVQDRPRGAWRGSLLVLDKTRLGRSLATTQVTGAGWGLLIIDVIMVSQTRGGRGGGRGEEKEKGW